MRSLPHSNRPNGADTMNESHAADKFAVTTETIIVQSVERDGNGWSVRAELQIEIKLADGRVVTVFDNVVLDATEEPTP